MRTQQRFTGDRRSGFTRRSFISGMVGTACLGLLGACAPAASTPTQPSASKIGSSATPSAPTSVAPTAASTTAAKAPTQTNKVELIYTSWATDTLGNKREQSRIDLFKKLYPDSPITINMRNIANSGYRQNLLTQLAGGVGPDVYRLRWEDLYAFKEQGQVLELDEPFKRHPKNWLTRTDLRKQFTDSARINGKLYGAPHCVDMSGLQVNKDLVKKAGLSNPPTSYEGEGYSGWTFDAYLEAAKKMTIRQGSGPIEQYGADVYNRLGTVVSLVESFGGRTLSGDFSEFMWHEEPALKAIQWFADTRNVHKVAVHQGEATTGGSFTFTNGLVGMTWHTISNLSYRVDDVGNKFDWDALPHPHLPGQQPKIMFWYSAWVVQAKTKYPGEAFEWLHFISGPEGSVPGVETGWEFPLFSELDSRYSLQIPKSKSLNINVEAQKYAMSYRPDQNPRQAEAWSSYVTPALDEILLGTKTAAAAIKEIKPSVDKLLKEGAALMK